MPPSHHRSEAWLCLGCLQAVRSWVGLLSDSPPSSFPTFELLLLLQMWVAPLLQGPASGLQEAHSTQLPPQ